MHDAVAPAHAVDDVDVEAYPGVQEHATGCDDPPSHKLPAGQLAQVAAVPVQDKEVVDVLVQPGEHSHATEPLANWYPAVHATVLVGKLTPTRRTSVSCQIRARASAQQLNAETLRDR